jgi:hypothetical protein
VSGGNTDAGRAPQDEPWASRHPASEGDPWSTTGEPDGSSWSVAASPGDGTGWGPAPRRVVYSFEH